MSWLGGIAFIAAATWLIRAVRAIRQWGLTRALASLKAAIAAEQPGLLTPNLDRWMSPKTRASASGAAPFGPLTPRAWLRVNLDAPRAT